MFRIRYNLVTTSMLFIVLFAFALHPEVRSTNSTGSNEIFFSGSKAKHWQIFSINIDSGKLNQLTHSKMDKKNPSICNENKIIIYQNNNGEIYEYSLKRRKESKLDVKYSTLNYPHISSDCANICFSYMRSDLIDDLDIVLWDRKEGSFIRLPSLKGLEMMPKIFGENVFFLHISAPETSSIKYYSIPRKQTKTIFDESAVISKYDLSPDGNKLVYASNLNGNYDIYIFDRLTGNKSALLESPFSEDDPDFSPDGGKIVFRSNENGMMDLFILNLETNEKKCITSNIHARQPVW